MNRRNECWNWTIYEFVYGLISYQKWITIEYFGQSFGFCKSFGILAETQKGFGHTLFSYYLKVKGNKLLNKILRRVSMQSIYLAFLLPPALKQGINQTPKIDQKASKIYFLKLLRLEANIFHFQLPFSN